MSLDLEPVEREVRTRMKRVLFTSMLKMEELTKIRAPVDTGRLRQSIFVFPRNIADSYILGVGVHYAIYVEMGTTHMVEAHGPHDPENPVTDWEAKRERGATDMQMMPFARPALLEVKTVWLKRFWDREMQGL